MTDLSEVSELERVIHTHRQELKQASTSQTPTTEERLWKEMATHLLDERSAKRADSARKADARREENERGRWTVLAPAIVLAVTVAFALAGPAALEDRFRLLAIGAAVLAFLSALVRQLAHARSTTLDGIGKSLGLGASLLALLAAVALFVLTGLPHT